MDESGGGGGGDPGGAAARAELLRRLRVRFRSVPGIEELSEDILQQAYLEVLSSPSGRGLVGSLPYMTVASRRAAYRVLGRLAARMARESDCPGRDGDGIELAASPLPGPVESLEQACAAEALKEAARGLDALDRRILLLRHDEGMRFASLAELLGLPLGTVLSRHSRALGRLGPRLADWVSAGAGTAGGRKRGAAPRVSGKDEVDPGGSSESRFEKYLSRRRRT